MSKSTIKKIRKIARAANLVRDLITMFDLKERHFAAGPPPPDEKRQAATVANTDADMFLDIENIILKCSLMMKTQMVS